MFVIIQAEANVRFVIPILPFAPIMTKFLTIKESICLMVFTAARTIHIVFSRGLTVGGFFQMLFRGFIDPVVVVRINVSVFCFTDITNCFLCAGRCTAKTIFRCVNNTIEAILIATGAGTIVFTVGRIVIIAGEIVAKGVHNDRFQFLFVSVKTLFAYAAGVMLHRAGGFASRLNFAD